MLEISISTDKMALSIVCSCQILSMKPPKAMVDPTVTLGCLPLPHLFDCKKYACSGRGDEVRDKAVYWVGHILNEWSSASKFVMTPVTLMYGRIFSSTSSSSSVIFLKDVSLI
jgi:hypothetical protein